MDKQEYKAYLKSQPWRTVRRTVISERGHKCERCGATEKPLQLHHTTYKFLGRELDFPGGISVLCDDCHENTHGIIKTAEQIDRDLERWLC